MQDTWRVCLMMVAAGLCGCGENGTSTGSGGSTTTTGDTTTTDDTTTTTTRPSWDPCTACRAVVPTAVGAVAIPEASGLAASAVHDGIFYVHDDSGASATFSAIEASGAVTAQLDLASPATNFDWEDAAVGSCPAGQCIYIGDIGDNALIRSSYVVYRVPEPSPLTSGPVSFDRIEYTYPDGSHNAETLFVDADGRLYVVTKVAGAVSSLYRFPTNPSTTTVETVEWVIDLEPPTGGSQFTGGDAGEVGVLLRTYSSVFFYPWLGDVGVTLSGAPCKLPSASEPQGETIAWRGEGYYTVSEGTGSSIYEYACNP